MTRLIDADALLKGKEDHSFISTHEIWNAPTVDAVDRKLFNKVCELFASDDPQWICDEMSDHDDEWEVCEENCKYTMCQPQCIERYARLLLKMGKDDIAPSEEAYDDFYAKHRD